MYLTNSSNTATDVLIVIVLSGNLVLFDGCTIVPSVSGLYITSGNFTVKFQAVKFQSCFTILISIKFSCKKWSLVTYKPWTLPSWHPHRHRSQNRRNRYIINHNIVPKQASLCRYTDFSNLKLRSLLILDQLILWDIELLLTAVQVEILANITVAIRRLARCNRSLVFLLLERSIPKNSNKTHK